MKTLHFFLTCSFIFFLVLTTNAAVVTWTGGTGIWDDDNNWDTGSVPTLNDGVIIANGSVTVVNYAEANYIHLDGGDLTVDGGGLLYVSPDIPWSGSGSNSVKGMMIENGSSFENYGNAIFIEPYNFNSTATLIYCDGDMTNHDNSLLFFQGENSTGLHTYTQSGTVYNYGEIVMSIMHEGMYLINSFRNYGDIEISADEIAITNRATFYSGSASNLEVNGRIHNSPGSIWNQYGNVEVNYTSTSNSNVMIIDGLFEIQNSGSLDVQGSSYAIYIPSNGTLRVRGEMVVVNNRSFSTAITNSGLIVNHQKGVMNTSAHYGFLNGSGAEVRNFGTWNFNETQYSNYSTLRNSGVFSNRPKGKMYVEGKLKLDSGTFNNQGHMFVLGEYSHQSLSGNFNNTGTLNDVHDHMSSISNNTSYRVHKMAGPFTEGVPVPNILDKGNSPGATVLSWYTTPTGNTIAGSYNSSTNTFTPNSNAVGLTSLYVRTRINTGGVTRRHELIVENGINSNPSPFIKPDNVDAISSATMTIAPNPIHDNFTIAVENTDQETMNYAIYNSMGQKEKSGIFDVKSNTIKVPHHLPSGIYFVRVIDKDGIYVETQQIRIVR